MKEDIDFSKTYEHAVTLSDDTSGELGSGTLVFGDGKWAHFKFDELAATTKFDERQKFPVLKAKNRGGDCFTLFDCVFSGFVIHADYVVSGDVSGRFKEIVIRFSDITEWFMRWQRLDGKLGESIRWVNHPQPLSAIVKTSAEYFSLKSEVESECTHTGEDYLIHEHVLFCYENLQGFFGAKDIQGKALELLALLSILIAYPLSIVSVWVKDESGRYYLAYFPTYKRIERDASGAAFANKCLVSKTSVDGKWQAIVDSYYNSAYRKVSWVRLAGMQRYEGFWEYETLGYVSMLDKFVTQYAKQQIANPAVPLSTKLVNFNQSLSAVLPALSESQCQDIVTLAEKVFAGTREPNFSEKYQHAIASSDKDVIQIINISDDDFALIKRVRDKVAHGDAIDFLGRDVSAVTGIVQKITLLLTFWAFRDFGFTAREFIGCLRGNHNPLVLNPSLDTVHRERVTGAANFYKVSEAELERMSAKKGIKIFGCFTKNSEGLVEYSETYTGIYRTWREEHPNHSGAIKAEDIFGPNKNCEFVGEAYMECGKEHIDFHHLFVIDEG